MKQNTNKGHFHTSLVFKLLVSVLVILLIIFSVGHFIQVELAETNLYQQRDQQIQAQREKLAHEIQAREKERLRELSEQLHILVQAVKGPLLNNISRIQETSPYIEQEVVKRFRTCFQQNTSQTSFECLKIYSNYFTINAVRIVNHLMMQTSIQLLLSKGDLVAVEILDWEDKIFAGFTLNDQGEISRIQQRFALSQHIQSISQKVLTDDYLGKVIFYYNNQTLDQIRERAEQDILSFIKYTEQQVHAEIQRITQSRIIEAIIFFIISLLAISFIVLITIIQPLLLLKRQAEALSQGYFPQQSPTMLARHDELGDLAKTFQMMSDSIQKYYHQLQQINASLELKVQERTQELAQKNQELERLSITDKLTQVYNRVKLEAVFQEQINHAHQAKKPFTLMICDLDFFKKINDTYGHQAGDKVLIESAQILKNNLRKADMLGRWGGEEFLILCPETDSQNALMLAQGLCQAMACHRFTDLELRVTLSIGVGLFKSQDTQESLLERADQALYRAKAEGRNRACIEH